MSSLKRRSGGATAMTDPNGPIVSPAVTSKLMRVATARVGWSSAGIVGCAGRGGETLIDRAVEVVEATPDVVGTEDVAGGLVVGAAVPPPPPPSAGVPLVQAGSRAASAVATIVRNTPSRTSPS